MKIIIRILLSLVVIIILLVAAVFAMRFYNNQKWGFDDDMEDVTDLSIYPEEFEGGTVEHFEHGEANGFHFIPDDPNDAESIAVFGGSEGSPNTDAAEFLAENGYEVYAMFFFGADNQVDELNKVPLEFFGDFLEYAELNGEDVTLLGASKGAELGLVLTNYYDEINNLILYTPSSYVFMGLSFEGDMASSWTYDGEALPYIDLSQSDLGAFARTMFDSLVLNPVKYRETYESAVEMNDNREEAKISTDNFDGQALLFAGGDDAMWQGDVMAEQIGEALGDNAQVEIFEDAGHLFIGPTALAGLMMGGTEEANVQAGEESNEILLEFLEENAVN